VAGERPYLSIGEVLGLLLEEFPDVTISKIRFLESQGLIVPERTASGYRKFYDEDVDRLRFILREQKENFLPLRVIKDRLDTPPDGTERPAQRPVRLVATDRSNTDRMVDDTAETFVDGETAGAAHPAARTVKSTEPIVDKTPRRPTPPDPSDSIGRPATYHRDELVSISGLDERTLAELESFGLLSSRQVGQQRLYDEHDLAIAEVARGFHDAGVDVRHLKAWKIAADREAGLFEQRVLPVLRRRSPESRSEANGLLDELGELGGRLRAILVARAVSSLRDPR
jgi:DNA-binding transcriptional MerR regulator